VKGRLTRLSPPAVRLTQSKSYWLNHRRGLNGPRFQTKLGRCRTMGLPQLGLPKQCFSLHPGKRLNATQAYTKSLSQKDKTILQRKIRQLAFPHCAYAIPAWCLIFPPVGRFCPPCCPLFNINFFPSRTPDIRSRRAGPLTLSENRWIFFLLIQFGGDLRR